MKRRLTWLTLASISLAAVPFTASCDLGGGIVGIHMSSADTIDVPYGNFSYEGIGVTVDFKNGSHQEIPLTEEMISPAEQMKFFQIGEQSIEILYRSRYSTTMPINVVLNQFDESYALEGYECVYDGLPHTVSLNHELPEGASIAYPYGNIFTNAGVYQVVGVLSKNGYESKTLNATLTIRQASRDASQIKFEDATMTYTGDICAITATGVPEGVEVTYETFDYERDFRVKAVNAGKYRVVAHFNDTSANYAKIPDREAILTIEQAYYDVSGVELEDAAKEYDGLEFVPTVKNTHLLPTGVGLGAPVFRDESGKVVSSNADVGTYKVEIPFVGGDSVNFHPIEPLRAKLTVTKRLISIADKIRFDGKNVNFDENEVHSLSIAGKLPETVEVRYENNDHTYAGEYEVKAIFTPKNPNEYLDVTEMTAMLIIYRVRRSVKFYNEATEKYDLDFDAKKNLLFENGVPDVVGFDESVFTISSIEFYSLLDQTPIMPADFVVGTTYGFAIEFRYIDDDMESSVILSRETDNFTYEG